MFKRDLFTTTEEHFRAEVVDFLDQEVVPHHDAWAAAGQTPRKIWQKAGSAGLLCRTVSPDYGGQGGSFLESVVLIEELARRRISGFLACLQGDIVAPYLMKLASPEQKARWLPGFVSGETLGAIAMTEPGGGSAIDAIATNWRRHSNRLVLNGTKTHISNGRSADLVIVAARSATAASQPGDSPELTLVMVEADRPGLSRKPIAKSAMPALDTAEIELENCLVPQDNILGREGRGFFYLMSFLGIERLVLAIYAQAMAEQMLTELIEACETRRVGAQTVLDFQNTRFNLAELYSSCAVNRAFVDQAIRAATAGKADPRTACIAKLRCAELLRNVALAGVQLRGAAGVSEASGARATQDLLDSALQSIWGGTNEVMRDVIGRSLASGL
ncbi:acyl-CoA dehydrogenase family protein [Phaeobacter sp. HF9A]|uniref:acyl-CoA dehydrogenase family protein n=1 Tax=Phaeobacter sp. HF9A TaxID=2721561 RepID=UPI0014305ACD|nr:acyl-CoA dehydrogenase family protein [Phaeobacter sp. HF9A]NIZ13562.1 acyl-CoA dehydrogenase [Phaeobacter sp. HF9A]